MSKLYTRLNVDEQPIEISDIKPSLGLENEHVELIRLTKFSQDKDSFIIDPLSLDVFNYYEGKVAIVLLRSDKVDVTCTFLKTVLNRDVVKCEDKEKGEELRICTTPLYKPEEDLYVFFLESGLVKNDNANDSLFTPFFAMISSLVVFLDSGDISEDKLIQMMSAFNIYNLKAGSIDLIKEITQFDGSPYLFYISPEIIFIIKTEELTSQALRIQQEKILNEIRRKANDHHRRSIKIIDQHFLGIDILVLPEYKHAQGNQSEVKLKLLQSVKTMEINNTEISTRMLNSLVTAIVNSHGDNKFMNVQACWDFVIENEAILEYNNAVDFYKETLKEFFQDDSPKPTEDLIRILGGVRDNTILKYDQSLLKLKTNSLVSQYRKRLLLFLEQKEKLAFQLNDDFRKNIFAQSIEKEVLVLEGKLKKGEYKDEKFPVFLEDLRSTLDKFIKLPGGGSLDAKLLGFYKDLHIRMNNVDRDDEMSVEDSNIYRPQENTLTEKKKKTSDTKDENKKLEREVTQLTKILKTIQSENLQSSKITANYLELIKVEKALESRLEDIKNEIIMLKQKKKKTGCCSK